jgi:hypothetical protein
MMGTFGGALEARHIVASGGRLRAEAVGEVEQEEGVLVVLRVRRPDGWILTPAKAGDPSPRVPSRSRDDVFGFHPEGIARGASKNVPNTCGQGGARRRTR